MRYDLHTLTRRALNPRRKSIVIRDIAPPSTLATDLYLAGYKPVVELWSRYADRVISEYERTLSGLVTDSATDVQTTLDQADSEFSRLFLLLSASLRDWLVRTEKWQRGKWRGAVLSATKVDIGTLIGPEDARQTIGDYLEWNAALVKDVSAQARQRIASATFTGLTQRKPAREVAKEIREAVSMARDRSVRIAADQLSKVSNALSDERRRDAGLSVWEWRHSYKKHPRVRHVGRNGNYYSENSADVGTVVDGKTVMAAPAADDLPGRPPFCGCRSVGVLVFG